MARRVGRVSTTAVSTTTMMDPFLKAALSQRSIVPKRLPTGSLRDYETEHSPASGLGDLDAAAGADTERPAPGQQLEQLLADELAAPALQRPHLRLGLTTAGGHDDG